MVTMKNTELKTKTKNELIEEVRKHKNRAKVALILLIILIAYLSYNFIGNSFKTKDKFTDELHCQEQLETYFSNQTNMSISKFKQELCEESTVTQGISFFFTKFLALEHSWFVKFLIFLGVIYLIQVLFALVIDVLEVIILVFVIIKRLYRWVRSWFKHEKAQ